MYGYMVAKAPLALLAALAVSVPAAMASQAELDRLYAQLESIDERYGFPPPASLTDDQWEQYFAETQALYDQVAPNYERLDEMWRQYDEVVREIDLLDQKGMAIDEEYGIGPFPDLTQAQWDAYDAELAVVYEEMDAFWAEYDQRAAEEPGLSPDEGAIEALYDKIEAIDSSYGFGGFPTLTAAEWEAHEEEWAALEEEKAVYFERLDGIQSPYQGDLDAISRIESQIDAIDARYGIDNEPPDLAPQEWDAYFAETDPLLAQIEILEANQDAEVRAAFAEAGITMPEGEDDGFWADFGSLVERYPEMSMMGDPSVAQAEKDGAYGALAEASPEIQEIFERHGYSFPVMTADEFRDLDERISAIGAG